MAFSLTALISFLPQFLIGGLLAIYFYAYFRKLSPVAPISFNSDYYRISNSVDGGEEISQDPEPLYYIGKHTDFNARAFQKSSLIADAQILVLTLDLWIIISLVLSPSGRVAKLLPNLSGVSLTLLYAILGILLSAAILTTAVSRLNLSKKVVALLVSLSGALTLVLFYYAPLMSWVHSYTSIFRLLVLYTAVIGTCFATYLIATFARKKTAFAVSSYSSFISYGLTAFLFLLNLFTSLS